MALSGKVLVSTLREITLQWIKKLPKKPPASHDNTEDVLVIIEQLHYYNFMLWDRESKIRKASSEEDCVRLKREIDTYNEYRNSCVERIDDIVYSIFDLQNKEVTKDLRDMYVNSETVGQIIDKISILTLKILFRKIIRQEENESLKQLKMQQSHIVLCFDRFLEYLRNGGAYMPRYRQLKTYEDSDLIP
jgi:hypothetical protein